MINRFNRCHRSRWKIHIWLWHPLWFRTWAAYMAWRHTSLDKNCKRTFWKAFYDLSNTYQGRVRLAVVYYSAVFAVLLWYDWNMLEPHFYCYFLQLFFIKPYSNHSPILEYLNPPTIDRPGSSKGLGSSAGVVSKSTVSPHIVGDFWGFITWEYS